MKRSTLSWSPCWEGPTKEWTIGFIRKHRWRCDCIHDFDDLLQDAYLTFLKVSNRYPRVVTQAHFMTLYRTALKNEMHDRSRYMQRKREQHQDLSVDAADLCPLRIGEASHNGYLNLLIEQAPEGVRLALQCLLQNPPELRPNGHCETLNMSLRRVLDYDKMRLDEYRKADLTSAIRELLAA